MSNSIGENIKYYRKLKGMTQDELAKLIEMTQPTVAKYENNDLEPNLEILCHILNVLNISLEQLIPNYNLSNIQQHEIEICQKAVNTFGEYTQLDMVIEEMAELTQAISKLKRNKEHNVEEEVADVEIMLKQYF